MREQQTIKPVVEATLNHTDGAWKITRGNPLSEASEHMLIATICSNPDVSSG